MYTFKISDKKLKDEILELTTEYDIFEFYIGSKFPISRKFKSPLRGDSDPSFSIFVSKKERRLLFKDFGTGDSGDCFKFVQLLFGISYNEALSKIIKDVINKNITSSEKGKTVEYKYKPSQSKIEIKVREFNDSDLKYWNEYGISLPTLNKYNVHATSAVWVNDVLKLTETDSNPIYSYVIFDKFKIYSPFNKKLKWLSNTTSYDIQGYQQLTEENDLLIITKSLKDVMCLHELGYNSIACPSENVLIPSIIFENLKSRFNRVIVFYDNDKSGIEGASKISKAYDLESIIIPDVEYKDISDFVKSKGTNEAKKLLNKLCQTS